MLFLALPFCRSPNGSSVAKGITAMAPGLDSSFPGPCDSSNLTKTYSSDVPLFKAWRDSTLPPPRSTLPGLLLSLLNTLLPSRPLAGEGSSRQTSFLPAPYRTLSTALGSFTQHVVTGLLSCDRPCSPSGNASVNKVLREVTF